MANSDLTDVWAPRMLSVLRIMTGLQFLEHGTQKFFSFPMRAFAGTSSWRRCLACKAA